MPHPTLAQLAQAVSPRAVLGPAAALTAPLSALTYDSRQVKPGAVFVAVRGLWVDGHAYIDAALQAGAAAIIAETPPPTTLPADRPVGWLQVSDGARALGLAADAFYGHPSGAMDVLAVTGTNGKTTVAWLIHQLYEALPDSHRQCAGLVGTVENRFAGVRRPTIFTTPPSADLHALLAEMRDAGCGVVAVEASSHGLAQGRLAGLRVAVAGFTNLSRDHLDYHQTMEAYREAKERLFRDFAGAAVFNVDDPVGRALAADFAARRGAANTLTVSPSGQREADLVASELACDLEGSRVVLRGQGEVLPWRLRLVGRHNVENALVALGMARLQGVPLGAAAAALETAAGAPGRLERVPGPRNVIVDYAHTPDALTNVLAAVRDVTPAGGRVLCVFGAGGDRDPGKRPQMGAAVAEGADVVVVTSDNPRTEDPAAIVAQVADGAREAGRAAGRSGGGQGDAVQQAAGQGDADAAWLHVEVDRRAAIAWAVGEAEPEDVVLIAGKGHEDYQVLGTKRVPFSDHAQALEAMARLAAAR